MILMLFILLTLAAAAVVTMVILLSVRRQAAKQQPIARQHLNPIDTPATQVDEPSDVTESPGT